MRSLQSNREPTPDERHFIEMLKKYMGNSPFDDANVSAYADHGWDQQEWRSILPRLIPKLKLRKNGALRYGVGNGRLISRLLTDLWQRGLIGGDEGWYRMDVANPPYYPGTTSNSIADQVSELARHKP